MKKFTLIAGMALVALGASAADFNVEDGTVKSFAAKNGKGTYYNLSMSEYSVEQLTKAGNTVVFMGQNSDDQTGTQNLYIWVETFTEGTASTPAPGYDGEENMDFEYLSLNVSNAGWSGAGYNIKDDAVPMTLNDNTIFHLCYATTGTAPASVGLILLNKDVPEGTPELTAKVAVGADFNDNGTIFPSIGAKATEDWQTVEISFKELKKLWPAFNYDYTSFTGNVFSFLAGGVAGNNIAFDNCFFFTPEGGSAIEGVEADNADAPVEYFNLQGVKVANPEGGLFIKVQGNKATKVVL